MNKRYFPLLTSVLIFSIFYLKFEITQKLGYVITSNIEIPFMVSMIILLLMALLVGFKKLRITPTVQLLLSFFFNVPNFKGLPFVYSGGELAAQAGLIVKIIQLLKEAWEQFASLTKSSLFKWLLIFSSYLIFIEVVQIFYLETVEIKDLKIVIQALFAAASLVALMHGFRKECLKVNTSFVFDVLLITSALSFAVIYIGAPHTWTNNALLGGWYYDRFKSIFMDPSHLAFFLVGVWLFTEKINKINFTDLVRNYVMVFLLLATGSRGGILLFIIMVILLLRIKKCSINTLIPVAVVGFQFYFMAGVYIPAQLNVRDICGKGGLRDGERAVVVYTNLGGHSLCKKPQNNNNSGDDIDISGLIERTKPGADRITLIKSALTDLKESYYLGYGFGLDSHKTKIKESAHSIFFATLVELGIPGGILLIWFFVQRFTLFWKFRMDEELILLIYLFLGANLYPIYKFAAFWLLFAFLDVKAKNRLEHV